MSPVTVVGLKPSPQPRLEWSLVDGHVHSWLLREPKGDTPSLEWQAGLAATVISHPTCSLQCDLVTLPSRGGVYVCLLPFFFLTTPRDMGDLSSLTRDQTRAPCSESAES